LYYNACNLYSNFAICIQVCKTFQIKIILLFYSSLNQTHLKYITLSVGSVLSIDLKYKHRPSQQKTLIL
jgi:hypothetical protein